MRCTTYCTATSYDLNGIRNFLHEPTSAAHYRDSLNLNYKSGQVFLFSYGCLVCWGLSEIEEEKFLKDIKSFEKNPLTDIEVDRVSYVYGESVSIHKDIITVPHQDPILAKLAISYGLAQQIKLTVFESSIDKTIGNTQILTTSLAENGYIPMSRREISRKIGQLFLVRSSVNLHSDILDTPDFFWEYTTLEPLYKMTAGYFNVGQRTEVLNKRCDIIHELFQILGDDLNNRSAVRVEWVIVMLICIEILLTLVKIFEWV